jgi:hypothetical protein
VQSKRGLHHIARSVLLLRAKRIFKEEPDLVEQPESVKATLNIDFADIKSVVEVAVRRATAFLSLGLEDLEMRGCGDLSVGTSIKYHYFPENVDLKNRNIIRKEYQNWLIGSCLKELDQFYGIFLDKLWFALEACALHGTEVPAGYQFDQKFSRDTNVAKKQKRIANRLNIHGYYDEFNSLSHVRNALSHNAGMVRSPIDCNNEERDRLDIKWIGFDLIAIRGGEERAIEGVPFDTNEMPGEGETAINIRWTSRTSSVSANSPIELSMHQLTELCSFYTVMAEKLIQGVSEHFVENGIVSPPPLHPQLDPKPPTL